MKLKYEITLGRGDRTAIMQCITKWEIVRFLYSIGSAGFAVGARSDNCALCKMYDPNGLSTCKGCPLFEATGKTCTESNSPYSRWYNDCNVLTSNTMVETLKALLGRTK